MRVSEERFSNLFSEMASGCSIQEIVCDEQGAPVDYITLDVNKAFERILNVRKEEVVGQRASAILPAEELSNWVKMFGDVALGGSTRPYEQFSPVNKKHFAGVVFSPKRGQFAVTFEDITERKHAEDQLVASLKEKEILLREVHHRVKNNLAAIIALLDMQRKALGDSGASAAWSNLANRIKSMALVHERLYRSDNLSQINSQEYLSELVSHLRTSVNAPHDLRFFVSAVGIGMGLDTAVPVGMIVNELAVNAMKHAFPGNKPRPGARQCEITIAMELKDATITLIVADNGLGLPESIDWETTSTLGLRLVKMLGEHQLGGKIQLNRSCGTKFMLEFEAK
jgi:PAS domain S-box-containing protein